ncbi:MAG: glycosyltransferase family 2 protein [Xanthomonadales bacterium]|nr:glycosyltransferase family 2 protein [Xanthomonadales bacterium]
MATVKAPLAILQPWINYHLHSGIGRMVLYFDDPRDPAINAVQGIEQVTAIPCSDRHWQDVGFSRPEYFGEVQVLNVNHGFALAAGMGCTWAAHIDCDELILPLKPVGVLLGRSWADALKMTVLEAVSERFDYDNIFDARLFRRVPNRLQVLAAGLLGCRHSVRYGEYFRGHTESKMLVRLNAGVTRMGIHKPIECRDAVRIERCREIQLLHFDCVGFSDWDRKWGSRLEVTYNTDGWRPARQRQFAAYREATDKDIGAREALFRDLHMIPGRETTTLKRLGLLTTVELDRSRLSLPVQ